MDNFLFKLCSSYNYPPVYSFEDDCFAEEDEEEKSDWIKIIDGALEMFERFDKFVRQLSKLEISVKDVQDYFESLHPKNDNENLLSKELKFLEQNGEGKGWTEKVEASIKRLFTINKYGEAANSVKTAGRALGLENTFPVVERIVQATKGDISFQSQPLKSVSDDLIRAGTTFEAWGEREIETLNCLSKCGNILKWLKENIKDRTDLKTFSDLASIFSAGESDHELDRFLNFNRAVSGYAPLILDLNVDVGCTFGKFLTACQAVFAALKSDPEISTKLVESNRNLQWIKACKDQQGSVEQTSLKMVAKINQTGIYQISLPDEKSDGSKTLDNCVKMSYQKFSNQNHEENSSKHLSLEELRDLNSKLMLITAGTEGKKEVDRFSRILNLVEQVARLFIDLVNAGCHLFSQWTMRVTTNDSIFLFIPK